MSDSPFIVLDYRRVLHADQAERWLGRIVRDYRDPSSSYTPEDPRALPTHSTEELIISDFSAKVLSSRDSSLAASLGSISSAVHSDGNKSTLSFQTSKLTSLRLTKCSKYFAELRQLPEAKADLVEYLQRGGKPAYMIVGVMIWSDPSFIDTQTFAKKREFDGQVPLGTMMRPNAIDPGDPGVKLAVEDVTGRETMGSMAGSYIFAIEYKAVRRKLYSSMKGFTPTLENYGPRVKADRVLGSDKVDNGHDDGQDEAFSIEIDGDVIWTDTLDDEDQVSEIDLGDFSLAL